jgi:hypothetical protein
MAGNDCDLQRIVKTFLTGGPSYFDIDQWSAAENKQKKQVFSGEPKKRI